MKKILFLYIIHLGFALQPIQIQACCLDNEAVLANGTAIILQSPKAVSYTHLEKDEAYWNEFSKNWKEKIESKVFEMYMPVYEKHLTLEELKAVAAFYESPVGKKYKEASLIVMRETMPLLVKQLQTETFKVVRSEKSERAKRGEQRLKEYEQKQKRDKELYARCV